MKHHPPHTSPSPRLRTLTLGCKVNQYETEYVRQALEQVGYHTAQPHDQADLCVVNTCTVTSEADAKCRQAIRRLARENPKARIVVMGCYATRAPDQLARLPGVAHVLADKRELPDLLGRFGVIDLPDGISQFGDRHRAYVKVQDGCLLRCTYCIIPKVRPHMSSRPVASVLAEVQRLVDRGYREIVLTGIHLGHYGVDWNWQRPKHEWIRLSDLVRQLVQLPGDFRLRLSSIEATEVTRELLAVMADHPDRICPHLHVCMQSGSDRILAHMKRRWGAKRFINRCDLIRDYLAYPSLTTDVIVGFPGETEEDFRLTCEAVERVGFCKVHVFPFSARSGTPAAQMPDQVPAGVKSERVTRLMEVAAQVRHRYLEGVMGRQIRVLIERLDDTTGRSLGTACRYFPVGLPLEQARDGDLHDAIATNLTNGIVFGRVVSSFNRDP